MNYGYIQKHHWRRRVWNEMRRRVSVHPSDAVILYLAGPENLDREIAIEKGFSSENLIAIEHDQQVADALRASGQLTICGDLFDVLKSWNQEVEIHGVIADFCCGLERAVWVSVETHVMFKATRRAVWAINCMRGRDASTNGARKAMQDILGDDVSQKHRGKILLAALENSFAMLPWLKEIQKDENVPLFWKDIEKMVMLFRSRSQPEYTEYRSTSGQYFDSVIFSNPIGRLNISDRINWDQIAVICEITRDSSMVRQIAAVMAHRTRKLQNA